MFEKFKFKYAPDGDASGAGGGGGGVAAALDGPVGGSDGTVAGGGSDGGGDPEAGDPGNGSGDSGAAQRQGGGAPAAAPTSLTPEQIADLVGQTVQRFQPAQPVQQPQMSPEELDKLLRVYRPSPKVLAAIRSDDEATAVAGLQELVTGVYTQAATMAQLLVEDRMAQIMQQLNPLQQHVQAQRQEAMKAEFFGAYPQFKGLDPLLLAIQQQLINEGARFPDKKAAFAEVAKRADAMLKTLPGGGGGAAPAGGTGRPPGSQMSTLTGGGQGGGGNAGTPSGNQPAWRALYDK